MIIKTISDQSYAELLSFGAVVPRDNEKGVIVFGVGRKYMIAGNKKQPPVKVTCTQDCPYHLKIIN